MADVDEVIAIMGKPSDFEEDVENEYVDPDIRQVVKKRLFRDIDNRMIGGVCSGLGAYFKTRHSMVQAWVCYCYSFWLKHTCLFNIMGNYSTCPNC